MSSFSTGTHRRQKSEQPEGDHVFTESLKRRTRRENTCTSSRVREYHVEILPCEERNRSLQRPKYLPFDCLTSAVSTCDPFLLRRTGTDVTVHTGKDTVVQCTTPRSKYPSENRQSVTSMNVCSRNESGRDGDGCPCPRNGRQGKRTNPLVLPVFQRTEIGFIKTAKTLSLRKRKGTSTFT